jgi:ABC-type transport system involved in multi-copper enzyme maturation permease subunit
MATATGDLPEWLDPMVVKELRQGLRARWFVIPFVGVQAAAVVLIWAESLAAQRPGAPAGSDWLAHWVFWGLVFGAVAVVLPVRCLTGLSSELTGDNAHLCALAGLTRWRIATGKWLTHMVLAALVVISLIPYAIVRYFFGGVEFLPNLLALVHTLGASSALGALFLGASGFQETWKRALVALGATGYVGVAALIGLLSVFQLELGGGAVGPAMQAGLALVLVEVHAYFTLCGLQLARAHLRTSLHPWQVAPLPSVLMLFFASPIYFAVGGGATCGFGIPVVVGLMIWWMASLDRAPKPPRALPAAAAAGKAVPPRLK